MLRVDQGTCGTAGGVQWHLSLAPSHPRGSKNLEGHSQGTVEAVGCGGTVALLCPWPALPDRAEGKGGQQNYSQCWLQIPVLPGRLWSCRTVIC